MDSSHSSLVSGSHDDVSNDNLVLGPQTHIDSTPLSRTERAVAASPTHFEEDDAAASITSRLSHRASGPGVTDDNGPGAYARRLRSELSNYSLEYIKEKLKAPNRQGKSKTSEIVADETHMQAQGNKGSDPDMTTSRSDRAETFEDTWRKISRYGELQAKHLELQLTHRSEHMEHAKLQIEHKYLQKKHTELQMEHEELQTKHTELQIELKELQTTQTTNVELLHSVNNLETQNTEFVRVRREDTLQIEGLRHTLAAVVGRLEVVEQFRSGRSRLHREPEILRIEDASMSSRSTGIGNVSASTPGHSPIAPTTQRSQQEILNPVEVSEQEAPPLPQTRRCRRNAFPIELDDLIDSHPAKRPALPTRPGVSPEGMQRNVEITFGLDLAQSIELDNLVGTSIGREDTAALESVAASNQLISELKSTAAGSKPRDVSRGQDAPDCRHERVSASPWIIEDVRGVDLQIDHMNNPRDRVYLPAPFSKMDIILDECSHLWNKITKVVEQNVLHAGICLTQKGRRLKTGDAPLDRACETCQKRRKLCGRLIKPGMITIMPLSIELRRGRPADTTYWIL